jgi:hypothetical protein
VGEEQPKTQVKNRYLGHPAVKNEEVEECKSVRVKARVAGELEREKEGRSQSSHFAKNALGERKEEHREEKKSRGAGA